MSKKALAAIAAFVATLVICETFLDSDDSAAKTEPNGFRSVVERHAQIDAAIAAAEGIR
ncbi:hypothetical protein [Ahniella affigens]|uniref:hypothetical protein n=1 Tax=Ahniella affigens TaxID=2021234 RepID=UPI001472BC28|nr:hypothetical protein [Ahniella affigens]